MPISVKDLEETGEDHYKGFDKGEGITVNVMSVLSTKKAYTAEEVAVKTGVDIKRVTSCLGRIARAERIGRKFSENTAFYYKFEDVPPVEEA